MNINELGFALISVLALLLRINIMASEYWDIGKSLLYIFFIFLCVVDFVSIKKIELMHTLERLSKAR